MSSMKAIILIGGYAAIPSGVSYLMTGNVSTLLVAGAAGAAAWGGYVLVGVWTGPKGVGGLGGSFSGLGGAIGAGVGAGAAFYLLEGKSFQILAPIVAGTAAATFALHYLQERFFG